MRSRPDIDLRLPPVVRPGDDVEIEIVATSRSDTPIDFFDVIFEGEELLSIPTFEGPPERRKRPFGRAVQRLHDAGSLTEGEHRFTVRFKVPLDAPASYLGDLISIRYEVRVHVSIPWWPDLHETYELLVEPHPDVRPKPAPATASSAPREGRPFLELSLADTSFAIGDEVVGAFAVGNITKGKDEGVEISLVAVEHVSVNGSPRSAEQFRHNLPNVFRVPSGGRDVPFRFRVPREAAPSIESGTYGLQWTLQAALHFTIGLPTTCSIPVVIGRYTGRGAGTRHPAIGAARWRAGWVETGEPYGLLVSEDRLALVGARGDVRIQVTVYEGDDAAALAATFRYPSILLDLRVRPQLAVFLPTDLEAMFDGLEIEHRELDQAKAFLGGEVRDALRGVKVTSITDTELQVRAPVAGYDEKSLAAFLHHVSSIADALSRALDQIPPPAAMRDALPAWRAFAAETGGRLTVGAMRLQDASLDGALFDLRAEVSPDGSVALTRVELTVDPPLVLRARVNVDQPASFAWLPQGCHDLAKALRAQVERLEIESKRLTIDLLGPVMDPADLRPRMIEMVVLARRLRGERSPGPYR